jgi:hypothetical protein
MKSNNLIISKIISAFQILIGVVFIGTVIYTIDFYFNFGKEHIDDFEEKFSITKTFYSYHTRLFLGLAMIFGGVLYLNHKKIGYKISILVMFLMFTEQVQGIIRIIRENGGITQLFSESISNTTALMAVIAITLIPLLFLCLALYLIIKPVSENIRLNKKESIYMTMIGLICLFDQIFSTK